MYRVNIYGYLVWLLIVCTGISACNPGVSRELTQRHIDKQYIKEIEQNSEKLGHFTLGTFYGCLTVPAKNRLKKYMVGFDFTGDSCTVTIHPDKRVSTSLIDQKNIVISRQKHTDFYYASLKNEQVLVVQFHQDNPVSVTLTTYDSNNVLNYGAQGEGDNITDCIELKSSSHKCPKSR